MEKKKKKGEPGKSGRRIAQLKERGYSRLWSWVKSGFKLILLGTLENKWHNRIFPVQRSGASQVQFSSVTQSFPTLWDLMGRSMPRIPVHHQLLEFTQPMSSESVMQCNSLILCRPLLLLPSIISSIKIFSNESALRIRWPKY